MTIQEQFGLKPINLKWNIVRGDTAKLKVEFLQNDETTYFDISSWSFASSAYDYKGDILDELEVSKGNGYVEIIAAADVTENWGSGYGSVIAELAFDLEITANNEIWTPIIGMIVVAADITGGL